MKKTVPLADELMTTAIQAMQNISATGSATSGLQHEDFGRHVAESLRAMPERMSDLAKMKIQEVLYNVKYSTALEETALQNTSNGNQNSGPRLIFLQSPTIGNPAQTLPQTYINPNTQQSQQAYMDSNVSYMYM